MKETSNPQTSEAIFRRMMKVDDEIEVKYRHKRAPEEARNDALRFARTQGEWLRIEFSIHPELEEDEFARINESAHSWEVATKEARKGSWETMKHMLQQEAQTDMVSAANREMLKEEFPKSKSYAEQQRGEAFFNLANSLGV